MKRYVLLALVVLVACFPLAGSAVTLPAACTASVGTLIKAADWNTCLTAIQTNLTTIQGGGLVLPAQSIGDLLTANSATTFTRIPAVTSGQVLASQGAATAPAWTGAPTFSGTVTFGGTATSTKACVNNFTRIGPNFCRRSSGLNAQTWVDAVVCTARTTGLSLPADVKSILIGVDWQALSNNGAGSRLNHTMFYGDTGCTQQAANTRAEFREQTAIAAGTVLGGFVDHLIVPLPATDTFYTTQTNAGGNGNADVLQSFVEGYFD